MKLLIFIFLIFGFLGQAQAESTAQKLMKDCLKAEDSQLIKNYAEMMLAMGLEPEAFDKMQKNLSHANLSVILKDSGHDLFNKTAQLENVWLQRARKVSDYADVVTGYYSDDTKRHQQQEIAIEGSMWQPYRDNIKRSKDAFIDQYEKMMQARNKVFCPTMADVFNRVENPYQLAHFNQVMTPPSSFIDNQSEEIRIVEKSSH